MSISVCVWSSLDWRRGKGGGGGDIVVSGSAHSHLSLYHTAEALTDGTTLTDGGCRLGAATVLGHSQC